jgi:hypothetical protein
MAVFQLGFSFVGMTKKKKIYGNLNMRKVLRVIYDWILYRLEAVAHRTKYI